MCSFSVFRANFNQVKNKDDEKLNTTEMGKCEKFRYMKNDADM